MDPHKGNQFHKRHQNYLLWKSHGKHEDTKQQLIAVEPFLRQHIARHRGGNADNDQRQRSDKNTVDKPLKSRILKQLLEVFHGGMQREPFRRKLDRYLLGFERACQDPVKREDKDHAEQKQECHGQDVQDFYFIFHLLFPLNIQRRCPEP